MSAENKEINNQPDAVDAQTSCTAQIGAAEADKEQNTIECQSVGDNLDSDKPNAQSKTDKVGLITKVKAFFAAVLTKAGIFASSAKNKIKAVFSSKKKTKKEKSVQAASSADGAQEQANLDAAKDLNASQAQANLDAAKELDASKKQTNLDAAKDSNAAQTELPSKDNKKTGKERAKEKTPEQLKEIERKRSERRLKIKAAAKRIFNTILLLLSIAVVVLSALQIAIIGLGVAGKVGVIMDVIKNKNVMGIAAICLVAIVIIVGIIQIILSISSIVSKKKSFNLTLLSTFIGFYVAALFIGNEINDQIVKTLGLEFKLLNTIAIVSLIYSFLQLFNGNFKDRIFTITCGILCGTIAVLLFSFGVINFVEYTVGETAIYLNDINLSEYVVGIVALFKDGEISGASDATKEFIMACAKDTSTTPNFLMAITALALNFAVIFVAKIFPYMALSIIGYVVIVLSSSRGRQVYTIRFIKRVSVSLLSLVILMGICVAALYFLKVPNMAIKIDFYYIVYSIAGPIGLILFANLPMWHTERVNLRRLVKLS